MHSSWASNTWDHIFWGGTSHQDIPHKYLDQKYYCFFNFRDNIIVPESSIHILFDFCPIGLDYCVYSPWIYIDSFNDLQSFWTLPSSDRETSFGCCPYIEIPSLSSDLIYCGSFQTLCIWYCSFCIPIKCCCRSCLVKMNVFSIDFLLYFFIRRTLFFYSSLFAGTQTYWYKYRT